MSRRFLTTVLVTGFPLLLLGLVLVGCDGQQPGESSSNSVVGLASTAAPVQEALGRALAWIEASPTKVTLGAYTLIYGKSAKVAELRITGKVSGEPVIWGTWWWSDGTDYYFDDSQGAPKRLTPEMAMRMSKAIYPGAEMGPFYLVVLRVGADPYRLLAHSKVTSAAQQQDGAWKLELEASVRDLVSLDIPDAELTQMVGPSPVIRTALEVGNDGTIRSMSVTRGQPTAEAGSYVFERTDAEPTLPDTWVDMDTSLLQSALDFGWRESPADAAKDVDFTVYSLGDSYQGLPRGRVNLFQNDGVQVLFGYYRVESAPVDGSGKVTTTNPSPEGYKLLEFSESDVPRGEQDFVADKTLIKTGGQGDDAYSAYKTAKGKPGRSILVEKGGTYIFIERMGSGTADATEELLAAAAALRIVEP